jgi:hypothetical protein
MSLGGAVSTILVRITGDSKALTAAVGNANRTLSGLGGTAALKGAAIGAGIGIATAAVADFGQRALSEGDRVGDALTKLETQLDRDLVAAVDKAAGKMTDLGQSRQDVLELSAAFVDVGTALGVADETLAKLAPRASETAAALALIGDSDASTNIDLINKAASGSDKALRALGVNLTDAEVAARAMADTGKDNAAALTEGELAAARMALILEKLEPRLQAVAEGQGDVEQSTAALQAKWETLMGKIGEGLDGPLNDLLQWTLNGYAGWEMFADTLETDVQKAWTALILAFGKGMPILGGIIGLLEDITGQSVKAADAVSRVMQQSPNPDRQSSSRTSESQVVAQLNDFANRNGLTIL